MTGDLYVQSVLEHVPSGLPMRDQIALELRGHIAERTGAGQPLDDVLRQLGDPLALAESYLAAVPLRSATIPDRIAAKAIDAGVVAATVVALTAILWAVLPRHAGPVIPVVCILGGVFGFVAYTIVAEYRRGGTIGKRLMHIQVVRESGARISLGQAVLRQVPFFGQFYVIDALFALFTDRRQRAFELLTKTRAVAIVLCVLCWLP
jgi:uncharacterized RDD family membrane protein YckC